MSNRRNQPTNVISKALMILRAFTDEKKEWGVNELARYLDFPVSSLHRMLQTLRSEGILQVSEQTRRYKIGSEMIRISAIISSQSDIKQVARPSMQEISDHFNLSVYLALYHPESKMSFVDRVNSENKLQFVLDLGVLHPLYLAASGKAILSFLDEEIIEHMITEEINDAEKKDRLLEEILTIKSQGYAITRNERKVGSVGVAAPIYDAMKNVIGSITCIVPESNAEEELLQEISKKVMEKTEKISRDLGYLN